MKLYLHGGVPGGAVNTVIWQRDDARVVAAATVADLGAEFVKQLGVVGRAPPGVAGWDVVDARGQPVDPADLVTRHFEHLADVWVRPHGPVAQMQQQQPRQATGNASTHRAARPPTQTGVAGAGPPAADPIFASDAAVTPETQALVDELLERADAARARGAYRQVRRPHRRRWSPPAVRRASCALALPHARAPQSQAQLIYEELIDVHQPGNIGRTATDHCLDGVAWRVRRTRASPPSNSRLRPHTTPVLTPPGAWRPTAAGRPPCRCWSAWPARPSASATRRCCCALARR